MNRKHKTLLISIIVFVGILILTTPTVLKAIPPRYAYRLPEPLRSIAIPEQTEALLPTVSAPIDAASLLLPTATVAPIVTPTTAVEETAVMEETAVVTPSITATPPPTTAPTATPFPIPASYRLDGVQHTFQTWNNCGPATMSMMLSYFDITMSQEQTAAVLKPSVEDRNVTPAEMAAFVNTQTDLNAIAQANGTIDVVRQLVANDIPVVLEIGIEPPGEFRWMGWYGHYLFVVAYDDDLEQFWVYDSWFGTSEEPLQNATTDGRVLTYAQVETQWPQFNRNYIAVYRPEQADTVAAIVGDDMNEAQMWSQALETVQAETQASPDNAFYWFNLGTIYNAQAEYDKAALAFDQARAIGLPWRMLWYQFGPYEAYYQTGRYEDVIFLADTTLKDRPYFEESFYYRGIANAALGNMDEARRDLESAIEFNPGHMLAAQALEQMEN